MSLVALCAFVLAGAPAGADEGAVVFHGGTILAETGRVEALLAKGGRIVDLGSLEELESRHDLARARRVDLDGGYALPGLVDAHGHVASYGALLEEVDLSGSESYAEVVARIAVRAAELPAGAWVTGRGWDHTLWPERTFPHHAALSAAVPEHPVLVRRVDGHAALANARALEVAGLAGVHDAPFAVEGGRVVLDDEGRASGILIDTAMALVAAHVPGADEDDIARHVLAAQDALLSMGLTAVHDMGIDRHAVAVYRELADAGLLRLRIVGYLWGNDLAGPEDLKGLPLTAGENGRFALVGVKLMADGALGSRGAALLADYHDAPGERGLLRFADPRAIERLVRLAVRFELQPATHAIGDRANRLVLDAYEAVLADEPSLSALRPRIEHAQVVSPQDRARFAALGVVPSMQPTHATSDSRWVRERIGAERERGAYAWRTLASERSPLAFGSDFPVESPAPLAGLYAALTRQDAAGRPPGGFLPEQRLTLDEGLAAFTLGAAFAAREEDRRGRLAAGWFADLTVIDLDPAEAREDPRRLLAARVTMTVVDGEVAFDAAP